MAITVSVFFSAVVLLLLVEGSHAEGDQPLHFSLTVLSPHAIQARCEGPQYQEGIEFEGFRLNISEVTNATSGGYSSSELILPRDIPIIRNLKPGTTYKGSVEAKYPGADKFTQPLYTTATTWPEGGDKPNNLRLEVYASDYMEAVWETAPYGSQSVQGYRLNISDGWPSRFVSASRKMEYREAIKDLDPETTYTISVQPKYYKSEFLFGAAASATVTNFAEGTNIATGLKASAINATSVKVTWGPPLQKSLKPSSYIVRVGPKINIIQAEDLTGSSTLTGLQPDTRYGVSVEISYKHTNYRPPAVETNVRTEPAEEPEPFVPEPEIDSDEAEIYDDEADFYDDEEAIDNDEP